MDDLRQGPQGLVSAAGMRSRSNQPAPQPQIQLWPVAERVLVVAEVHPAGDHDLEQHAPISASLGELAQMIAASPELLARVTRSSLSAAQPASAGASSWAALSNGECSLETKQLLTGSTLLLVKTGFCVTVGWAEMDGLRRLGVARLMMRHPYRGDGSILV